MRLLLHAITPPEPGAVVDLGLRGAPLHRLVQEGLGAWATELPDEPDPFTRDDLLEHHAIASRIFDRVAACLPARFPTWYAPEALAARATALRNTLEFVRGRCELALTGVWTTAEGDADERPPSSPGTEYLLRRSRAIAGSERRRARATEHADELERRVADALVEARRTICPSEGLAFSLALLVPRASASELLARLQYSAQDVRILVNGPWPPYTFAVVG